MKEGGREGGGREGGREGGEREGEGGREGRSGKYYTIMWYDIVQDLLTYDVLLLLLLGGCGSLLSGPASSCSIVSSSWLVSLGLYLFFLC